jgi:methyl-accepting chemotaxis protein
VLEFINKTISRKIIFWMFILMTFSSIAVLYSTVTKVSNDNIITTKNNLNMLNTAIFQNIRNAMNTGDPIQIKKVGDAASTIKGVKKLTIAKSKALIEMYSPESKYTTDKDILHSFQSKQDQILETNDQNGHNLRMIKPMIATNECLMCHANQKEGDVIGIMDLTFSLEGSDESLESIIMNIIITSTILGWITIGIIFYVVTKATKPIEGLKNGFKSLIESKELKEDFRLEINAKDEIGDVAALFNQYMDKVRNDLKKDELVINETNDVLQKTANGFFVYEVHSTAANQHVEQMKKNLNFMIKKVKETLDKINLTLREYSQSKYDYKIDDKGIYGDLGAVTAGIKLVGNNTSEILAMVMNTGENLNDNTHTLSNASTGLSTAANTQASSLEETAAALEEITRKIKNNTQNTMKMSTLASNVNDSANHGEQLAVSTSNAMDDIVNQVSSINEALSIIDQIAFQTNILSLNAAVEAATAGEAGKGFAVVAGEVRNLATRSAEAASEIKALVDQATTKAHDGKKVAANMIDGYKELNLNIEDTTSLIDEVAKSSEEQQNAIIQINDAISDLDQTTQKNSSVADEISSLSTNIDQMSNNLVSAAAKASFLQETRKQVCDVDLIYEIANLKVALFKYKDDVYSRLADHNDNNIVKFAELDKWLDQFHQKYPNLDTSIADKLKVMNQNLYENLKNLMDSCTKKETNNVINNFAKNVEIESMRIFGTLNQIKELKCEGEGA